MKKLPLVLVLVASFSGFSASFLAQKPADAQVTKACKAFKDVEGKSVKVPIDPKSDKLPEGGGYIADAYRIQNGFTYFVSEKNGGTVSEVDLTYFKQNGVQKVKIRVCGRVQNNPNIPFLNFNFSGKVVKVKALGTQNLVVTVSKPANTTTIQTVLEVEPK